jgi:hypothetical protein
MIEHERLRVYALKRKHTLLLWCRDKENTWQTELQNGAQPETVRNLEVNLAEATAAKHPTSARIYDPWSDRWSTAKLRHATVTLPEFMRSAVVRVMF